MTNKNKLPKAKEMTNDQEVIQYDNEVLSLIDTYNKQMELANSSSHSFDMAFFDMGKKLIDIENKIENDNGDDKVKSKKVFAAFKIRISEKIKRNISNIDKVVKVAKFCETETYKKYEERLPNSWGTLYLLLSLKDNEKKLDIAKIDALMSDSEIIKEISRSELMKKIAAIKNSDKVIKKKVTIAIEGGIEPTQEQLEKLQKCLNRTFKKQWNVTTPEIKKKEPVKKTKKK